ncbi:MAG: DNA mismatch repair protein MutS, partial [Myxococcota bacterium]
MTRSALDTPMMRQYLALKARHPDAILFFRMGDFYEMFLADAELAAPILDIALTTRDRGKKDAVPMCGVPVHAVDGYIKRLAELGHRVAICEQVEDPRSAAGKRLVKRDVVEVVTPGLAGDPDGIEAKHELALVAIAPGPCVGLAILDATTGTFRATDAVAVPKSVLPPLIAEELQRIGPREILIPASAPPDLEATLSAALPSCALTVVAPESFDADPSGARPEGLEAAGDPAAARAATALYAYLSVNQPFALAHTSGVRFYRLGDAMVLDAATFAHLELFRNS